jgi:hypothetical protein
MRLLAQGDVQNPLTRFARVCERSEQTSKQTAVSTTASAARRRLCLVEIRLGSRSRSIQIKGQIRLRIGPDKPLTKTLPPYPPPDFRSEPDQRKDLSRWDFVPHGSGVETLLVCSLRSQTRRFLSRFSLIPPIYLIPPLPQIPSKPR